MSSIRLQVLIPPGLDARIRKAAQRSGVSKGEWVRRALETVLAGHGFSVYRARVRSRRLAWTGMSVPEKKK